MAETSTQAAAPASTGAALTGTSTAAPAAGGPASAASGAPNGTSAAASSWYEGAPTESVAWIQNKGFKSHLDLIESARNAEKLIGVPAEKVIKMTDKMRDDTGKYTAEARAIFERLGAPKDAKEYALETLPEHGDPNMTEFLRQKFHEEGVRKDTAENLMKHANAYTADQVKKAKEAISTKVQADDQLLRQEWGAAYEQNMNITKQAVAKQGLDAKAIDAISSVIGHAKTVKMLHQIGLSSLEGRFVSGTGNAPPTVLTPEQAETQMRELMTDQNFQKAFNRGDKEAIDRWTKLNMEKAAAAEYNLGQKINTNTWDSRKQH